MKFPLKWYQWLGREMVCWCIGHNWKSSSRHRADYAEVSKMDYKELKEKLPYRMQWENPYWEYSGRWHFKCRRCRRTTRDWPSYPYSYQMWYALARIPSEIKIDWECYNEYTKHTVKDFVLTVLASLWAPIYCVAIQLWVDSPFLPGTFWEWAFDVDYWLMKHLTTKEETPS